MLIIESGMWRRTGRDYFYYELRDKEKERITGNYIDYLENDEEAEKEDMISSDDIE